MRLVLLLSVVFALLGLVRTAEAALITFAFEGKVASVDAALSGTFSVGNSFDLNYTFESTTAGSPPPGPGTSSTYDAITSLSLTVGSFSASATGGTITIFDTSENIYAVDTNLAQGLTAPTVAGLTLTSFRLFLLDDDAFPPLGAFTDSSLPTALDLTPFIDNLGDPLVCDPTDCAIFRLTFEDLIGGGAPGTVVGVVTAAAAPVPEPATLAIFCVGLAGIGVGAAMRRRRTTV